MVEANGCSSAIVSWNPTQPRMCDVTILIVGYSVRYQLSGTGGYTTVNTSSTSVTLQDVAPNLEYIVSVAAITSIGNLTTYTAISFNITGNTPIFRANVLLVVWPWHCTHTNNPFETILLYRVPCVGGSKEF